MPAATDKNIAFMTLSRVSDDPVYNPAAYRIFPCCSARARHVAADRLRVSSYRLSRLYPAGRGDAGYL
jgi:hypothetical protein